MGIAEVIGDKRDAVIKLVANYGASNVRVFGSVARGEATPESDIDLLITVQDGVSMFDLVGLWLDLQDLLGRNVSLVTDDPLPRHERFMRRILNEAIPI